jgi:hypothetical protein
MKDRKINRYPIILQKSLEKYLVAGESLEDVVVEYPQCRDRLILDLRAASNLKDHADLFGSRPGFLASSKNNLLKSLDHEKEKTSRLLRRIHPLSLPFYRFLYSFLAVVVILFFSVGLVLSAQFSLPGDTLFPIKTASEGIRLALTFDEVKSIELHLQYAQDYMVACASLISQGRTGDAAQAVRFYERHVAGTARLLLEESTNNPGDFGYLLIDFNNRLLQDLGTFQVLLPGEF